MRNKNIQIGARLNERTKVNSETAILNAIDEAQHQIDLANSALINARAFFYHYKNASIRTVDMIIQNLENLERTMRKGNPSGAFTIRQALRLLGRTPNLPI